MNISRNQIVKNYGIWVKGGLFLINFFLMFITIQTYVNYTTIIENTLLVEKETQKVKDEMSYHTIFQIKYLNSNHAQKLLAHENGVLEYNEAVINFKITNQADKKNEKNIQNTGTTPRTERKNFFSKRLESN